MQITQFNQMLERTRAVKQKLFESIGANQITASAGPDLASRLYAVRAQLDAARATPNAAPATTPNAARGLPDARTTQELLAELNSISDPADQTTWWRSNFKNIKAAQRREIYARANKPQALPE